MSEDRRTRLRRWLASGEASLHPLTFPQRELWESSPAPPEDVSNHICCVIHMRGMITPDECTAAVQRVLNRQEVMRLSFLPGKERPLQLIRLHGEPNMTFRELQSSEVKPDRIEEIARETFAEPFDLMQGPLYRAKILRCSADEHVLVFAVHHAIADGWSLGVFVQDLAAAYMVGLTGGQGQLPPVPMSYSAWGATERAFWQPAELEQRAAYWKSTLADTQRLWTPEGGSTSVIIGPQQWESKIPADLTSAVRDLARRHGATLYSTLLAAFQIALSRWTRADDIVVGTPVANRTKQAVRETMGYYAGVVPIRGRVYRNQSFTEHLHTVHQTTVDAFANAMPFAELAQAMGETPSPAHNPVFQIRFALQNHPVPDVDFRGLSVQLRMRSTGTPRFDLGCELTEVGDGLQIVWLFKPHMFCSKDVKDLDALFQEVLSETSLAPDKRTARLKA